MKEAEFSSNQFLLNDIDHYFDKALAFLEEFQWCFNYPVTHLLVRNIVKNIPSNWIEFISNLNCDDLNAVGHGDGKEEWPGFVTEFTKRRQELALPATENNPNNCNVLQLEGTMDDAAGIETGMNPKKQMEVKKLARLIHEECKPLGITNLLDIGSGLGHLSLNLHTSYGYRILGLETNETFVKTANARRRKVCSDDEAVQFKQFHLDTAEECILETKEVARLWLENCCTDPHRCEHSVDLSRRANKSAAVALIGLHACGNLAGSILRLFASSDAHSAVILLPCCFHKMSCVEDGAAQEEPFQKFPWSKKLQRVLQSREKAGSSVLNTQFLRLASQKSSAAWSHRTASEHRQQGIHVLARSVLQLYAESNRLQVRKLRRRAISKAKLGANNTDIIENMTSRYAFVTQNDQVSTNEISKDAKEEIKTLYFDHERLCPVIEGLNALQSSLQSVAERLVLTDMLTALVEACGDMQVRCHVTTLWDEAQSPRARAIIASRFVT